MWKRAACRADAPPFAAALLQAITFSSADRFKMLGSYFNVTAGEGVNHSS
jgi:hypothetical protein